MKKLQFLLITVILLLIPCKQVFAYSKDAVTTAQLQTALSAFKNQIDTHENFEDIFDQTYPAYYTVYFTGDEYIIYATTEQYAVYPPLYKDLDHYNYDEKYPDFFARDMLDRHVYVSMKISSTGSYTLPTSGWNAHTPNIYFYGGSFVAYTSYPIYNAAELPLKGAIPLGTVYAPTAEQSVNSVSQHDTTVPTPKGLRVKFELPKLFQPITSTLKFSWTPETDTNLYTEIFLQYTYGTSSSKSVKRLQYKTYANGISASSGSHKVTLSDLETFIHNKDTTTSGMTYANGKLTLDKVLVRYCKWDNTSDKLLYGNSILVDLVTGQSILDKGDPTQQYDEIYQDDNGNDVTVPNEEYGGKVYDNDGKYVDPTSLRSLTDYLMAIPNMISSIFSSFMSLLNGIGSFGTIVASLFAGMPPQFGTILVAGIGAVVVIGIVKFIK